MFVGHYSVSLAARRSTVDLPLWVWFVAVQWLDLGFMTFVLLGIEKDMPEFVSEGEALTVRVLVEVHDDARPGRAVSDRESGDLAVRKPATKHVNTQGAGGGEDIVDGRVRAETKVPP